MRIIFVPQYPTPLRYQEWWYREFQNQFKNEFDEVIVLGSTYGDEYAKSAPSQFSPANEATFWETCQIREYMDLQLYNDDIMFVPEISFPGFFMNVLYHKRPKKVFAFCHATSKNEFDYFEGTRFSKYMVERAHAKLCEKVFLGSYYHKEKLDWENSIVTYLPFPPFKSETFVDKTIDICSAARPSIQKVDFELESRVQFYFNTEIKRPKKGILSWNDYFRFLTKSKVMLVTSREETFGYQIVDAVMNNCIPIAPQRLSYPELLPAEYLYQDEKQLIQLIGRALDGELEVPKLKCETDMKNFYSNIISIMKG